VQHWVNRRWLTVATVGLGTSVLIAGVVWLTMTVARGELDTGDQLASVISAYIGICGLVVTVIGTVISARQNRSSHTVSGSRLDQDTRPLPAERRLEAASPQVQQEIASVLVSGAESQVPVVRRALRYQYTRRLLAAFDRIYPSELERYEAFVIYVRTEHDETWWEIRDKDLDWRIMVCAIYSADFGMSSHEDRCARDSDGALFLVKESPPFEPSFNFPPWRSVIWESAADDAALVSALRELLVSSNETGLVHSPIS